MLKIKLLLFLVIIISVFSLVTLYQYYNEDLSELKAARAISSSEFIDSETGLTRYKVFGEKNSPTVVLIHSFNGFLESWDLNINDLVNSGYRVVVYDLYGRGLSDRPRTNYDLALFRDQLDIVIGESGAKKVHLIGSSFGCVIASDYAIRYPEKVDSLVMIGPAGWVQEGGRNPMLDVPIVGDLAFHYFGENILRPKVEAYLFNRSEHTEVVAQWSRFAGYSGFTRSALSTLRHSPVLDYMSGWEQLATLNKPVLFIWGKQDVSFPFANAKKLANLIPHAQLVGIDNAAHWVNIEQADVVNSKTIEFLKNEGAGG